MTMTIRCFTRIADAEPAKVLTGDSYQALIERPSPSQAKDGSEYARVILNPNHDDPKKSAQIHVRAGDRNSTDPLRFERVEVYEDHNDTAREGQPLEDEKLVWYGDIDGNSAPVTVESVADEEAADLSFKELVAVGATAEALKASIASLDYKTLAEELTRLKADVPQKRADRETSLLAAVLKVPE